jgi:PAS domain S-box-containing protein
LPALTRELLSSLPAAVAYLAGPDLVVEFANEAYRRLVGGQEDGQPEQIFADLEYRPVHDADGTVTGVLLYAADVTAHVGDRRRLETLTEQLATTEERYRTLFEAMPQGVIHYSADGSVLGMNPAVRDIMGIDEATMPTWPTPPARQAVHEDGSPYRPEDLPVAVALRTGGVVANVVMGMPHARTGDLRWLRVTAVPDGRDREGRPQRAYSICTDLTEERRMEAALQENASLLGRLWKANVLGVAAHSEQGAYDANDAFLDIIGYDREDLAAGRISYSEITAPEFARRDRAIFEQLRTQGAFQPYEKAYLHRDGHRVPVLVGGAVVDSDPLRWVTFAVDLTARDRAEQERARLLAREQAAHTEAASAREQVAFLLRAGAFAAATRNRHELLEHAAQLMVPGLADHCVVYLPTADDTLYGASLAHRDPDRASVLAQFRDLRIPTSGPMVTQVAYTSGASQILHSAVAQLPDWPELAADLGDTLDQLRPDCVLAVPVIAGDQTVGVLTLARDADRPAFADTDVKVAEEFARLLADAMANAETSAREHTIAETLQRAVLPDTLPAVPGLDLAVGYLPASDGVHVGGDWYDVFPLGDNRVGLVIGDVAGHSIGSASIMGQVRSMLRAYAIDHPNPGDVLQRTNTALARLLPDAIASAIYAVLDLNTGDLTYANAGHPPPLITTEGGHAGYLDDAPGVMLGSRDDIWSPVGQRRLAPGTGLLFYTDGLIEDRHRDIDEGLSALAGTVQQSWARTADEILAAAESMLYGEPSRADDVCLLAARFGPGRTGSSPSHGRLPGHGRPGRVVPGRARAVPSVRDLPGVWLYRRAHRAGGGAWAAAGVPVKILGIAGRRRRHDGVAAARAGGVVGPRIHLPRPGHAAGPAGTRGSGPGGGHSGRRHRAPRRAGGAVPLRRAGRAPGP